jgi:hypothetical protein
MPENEIGDCVAMPLAPGAGRRIVWGHAADDTRRLLRSGGRRVLDVVRRCNGPRAVPRAVPNDTYDRSLRALPRPRRWGFAVVRHDGVAHREVSLYTGLAAAQALDVHSTLRAIDAGSREANAMMRWATASPARFIAIKAATTAGTILILERLRRTHPKHALFLLVGLNSASAVIIAHNYRAAGRQR